MDGANKEISRRDFLKLSVAVTGSALLAEACKPLSKIPATETPKPTAQPTATLVKENTVAPATPTKPDATRIPEATATPAEKLPKTIGVGSLLETNLTNPSVEKIKFFFPEGVVGDKSALIPPGETMTVLFDLKSGVPIKTLNINMEDLLGINIGQVGAQMNATSTAEVLFAKNYVDTLLRVAKGGNQTLMIDNSSRAIINKIEVGCGHPQNSDPNLLVKLVLPNETYYFTDKTGVHSVNPAQRFVSGQMGLGFNRTGELKPGTVLIPAPLKAEHFQIFSTTKGLVANVNDVDIKPPLKITTDNKSTQPAEVAPAPTSTPAKKITVESGNSNPQPKTPENPETKSKWTETKWAPNQTISLKEWWNDMTAKGYISVDSLAQQYGGKEIDALVNGSNLVPNPVEYYKQGYGLVDSCKKALDQLVSTGQGHIKVVPEAYANIPGSNNCQVFQNKK